MGTAVFEPDHIDFGVVMVNFAERKKVTIRNTSDSMLNVVICLKNKDIKFQDILSNSLEQDADGFFNYNQSELDLNQYISIDFREGVLPAKSSRDIEILFKPFEKCDLNANLIIFTRS